MPEPGLNAYKQTIKTTISGRDLEASILTKAAFLLKECQEHWDEVGHFRQLDEALRFNQRIWTIFQDELVRDDNPMPKEIRENILSLSVFIDKRLIQVMAHPEPETLKMIIDINLNLAAGLRGSPA
jgi:flagellar biosynthesis activator protein FlaF